MAGASDILQQALENSGLTGRVPENGQEASLPHASSASTTMVSVSSSAPRSTVTVTVHDSATGVTKRHLIRKVGRLCGELEWGRVRGHGAWVVC